VEHLVPEEFTLRLAVWCNPDDELLFGVAAVADEQGRSDRNNLGRSGLMAFPDYFLL